MCNDYRSHVSLDDIGAEFGDLRIPLRFPAALPNLEPRDDIRITDIGAVVRSGADGQAELSTMRWSWPGPGGKPVYNFRSEGREFGHGRCLVVADGFYEFTSAPGAAKGARKAKWLFTMTGAPWFCMASLSRQNPDRGDAFTMRTTEPGTYAPPYHNRQTPLLGSGW